MGVTLGHPNATCYSPGDEHLCVADLVSYETNNLITTIKPKYQFLLLFSNHQHDNKKLFSPNNYEHFMSKNFLGIN